MKTRIVPTQNIARLKVAAHALINRSHTVDGMGLVEGAPGTGKTTAITWLVNKEHGIYVRALATWTPAAMLAALLKEVDRAPRGSCSQMVNDLMQSVAASGRPLFIDEGDYVIDSKRMTETLRDIHDMTKAPVVLIGMEGIGKKLAHREQLVSRVTQTVRFGPCDLSDTTLMAEQLCEVKVKPDLIARVHQLTHGSARRVVGLLADIEQHARARKLEEVGLADYKKGAEVLVEVAR